MYIFIFKKKKNSAIRFFSVTFFSNISLEEDMACYNYPVYQDNTIPDNENRREKNYKIYQNGSSLSCSNTSVYLFRSFEGIDKSK